VIPLRDEDVAVRRDSNVERLVQVFGRITGLPRRAERQQDLALRAELDNDVTLDCRGGKARQLLARSLP
jgi:hypothetical protein